MAKSETILLRLEPEEKDAFKQAADMAGIPLANWIRERLRKAVRIELEEAGRKIPFIKREREEL